MKNLLVPIGSMEDGKNNLQYAVNLAAISGARVYLVSLYKEFSKVAGLTKVNKLMMQDSEVMLNDLLSQVDVRGVEVLTKSIKGDAYESIQRLTNQLDIDLLILSPKSVDKNSQLYLGSVTGKIVKQMDVPILIVPKTYLFRKTETILLAFKRGYFEKEDVLDP